MTRRTHPRWARSLAGSLAVGALTACVAASDDEGDTEVATATQTGSGTPDTSGEGTTSGTTMDGSSSSSESMSSTGTTASSSPTAATTGADSGSTGADSGSTGSGNSGGIDGGGTIDVTLSGCSVDLGGTVVVSYNGSLGVASIYDNGATLSGSFQFDLMGAGAIELSTQHRVDTGEVINLVDIGQGTWTNLDSDSLAGGIDRIGGTVTVNAWDPASGVSDLEFAGVSLLNVGTDQICTIEGTIVTTELYP